MFFLISQIGFSKVSESRSKMTALENKNERRFLVVSRKFVDPKVPILAVFLNDQDLYVVSEKRIFKMVMTAFDQIKK